MRKHPLATALVVGLSLTLALAGFPVFAMYRRIERPRILLTETRRRVYEHVANHPGATAGEIADLAGFDRKTAAHHARLLHRHALFEVERDGRSLRYFLPGHRGRRPVAHGVAAAILRLTLARPGLSQAEAASALGVCRATVQWHARKLADRGFLEKSRLRVPANEEARLREALGQRAVWRET